MLCCNNAIPTIGVSDVTISGTTATINLTGAVPTAGRFNIRVCGDCLDKCSGATVTIVDAAGTSFASVLDRCGNVLRLNQVAVQACRHRVLHFCRSVSTNILVLQDCIDAPTPVIETTAT